MNIVLLYQQEAELGEFFTLTMVYDLLINNGVKVKKATLNDIHNIKDSKVYITKHVTSELVFFLKNRGNRVYLDMVDLLAHIPMENINSFLDWNYNVANIDVILFRQPFLKDIFIERSYYIPQHYNFVLNNIPQKSINLKSTKISFPYSDSCGSSIHKTHPELFDIIELGGKSHIDLKEIIDVHDRMTDNNFYFGHRETNSQGWLFKPATKVATAAAVNRNIITNMDRALEDLLPNDYPYLFTEGDFLEFYESKIKSINIEEYEYGLKCLEKVKQKTNINNQFEEYKKFFDL